MVNLHRKKEGLSPANTFIRSILIPFGLEPYVGGNKDNKLKLSEPSVAVAASNVSAKELFTESAGAGGVS